MNEMLRVRLDERTDARLTLLARQRNTTKSTLVRDIIGQSVRASARANRRVPARRPRVDVMTRAFSISLCTLCMACPDDYSCPISTLRIAPLTCVSDVQLSFQPSYPTVGVAENCSTGTWPNDIEISEPVNCPQTSDDLPSGCSGTVTVICASGEVDTFDVQWRHGCYPSPTDVSVCRQIVGSDSGTDAD